MSLFDFYKKKKKPEKKKPEEKPASAPAFAKATTGKKAKLDKKATALSSEALKERRREGGKKEVKKPTEEKKVVEDKESHQGGVKPKKGKETPQLYRILKSPHVSEKATDLAEKSKYVFKVFPEANKTEIKKAVKNLYGVDVLSVNIIKIPPKKRRLGKISGFKKGYKKAIIKIKKGQKLKSLI